MRLLCALHLARHNIGSTRPFLALADFKLNLLTLVEARVAAATFYFRVMNE